SSSAGGSRASWLPALTQAGWFDVYAWWTAASNRAAAAPYTIRHLDGVNVVSVDQRASGGQWNLLGRYALTAGAQDYVSLQNDVPVGSVVSADAVRLVYAQPVETIVDNTDPGFSTAGSWPASANSG